MQSIHHSGTILLWWSGDGATFHVKQCDEPVPADTKIDSLQDFAKACKGTEPLAQVTRDVLAPMLVEIASDDAGFDGVLRDEARRESLTKIKDEIASGKWSASEIDTQLAGLRGQLTDLALQLETTRKKIATMQATANAAAAAANHVATQDDIDLIYGQTYGQTQKALIELEEKDTGTRAGIDAQLKAYESVQTAIDAARTRLSDVATGVLATIADHEKVVTVSLLQTENFEFALLQSAAIRLGLVKSHSPQVVTCNQACSITSPFHDNERCYSCRCKEAMGGSLPTPEEISCKTAQEIKIYKLTPGATEGFDLAVQTATGDECWNPSLLYGDCQVGSRLGQLQKGDVHYKWICRYRAHPTDPNATYDDVGVIAINTATGASCWWDDNGGSITDADFPKLDIADATPAEIDRYKNVWNGTRGSGCTGCHDNDPFMFSPYFNSIAWQTGDWTASKFSLVQEDGTLAAVGHKYLASDEAAECTSCHRIADGRTCSSWAAQSTGGEKGNGFEELVLNAVDKVEGDVRKAGTNWQLAYWMPPSKPFTKGTYEKWHQKYGKAKDTISKCCTNPAAPGCTWADVDGNILP